MQVKRLACGVAWVAACGGRALPLDTPRCSCTAEHQHVHRSRPPAAARGVRHYHHAHHVCRGRALPAAPLAVRALRQPGQARHEPMPAGGRLQVGAQAGVRARHSAARHACTQHTHSAAHTPGRGTEGVRAAAPTARTPTAAGTCTYDAAAALLSRSRSPRGLGKRSRSEVCACRVLAPCCLLAPCHLT